MLKELNKNAMMLFFVKSTSRTFARVNPLFPHRFPISRFVSFEQAKYSNPFLIPVALLSGTVVLCSGSFNEPEPRRQTFSQNGRWKQVPGQCETMRPFLIGLGVPGWAAFFVDSIKTELTIKCNGEELSAVDQTLFGKNVTNLVLGGPEVERSSRNGRKKFMLSGFSNDEGVLTVQCRLFERGEGWYTQQVWSVQSDGLLQENFILRRPDNEDIVVKRIFHRIGEAPEEDSDWTKSVFQPDDSHSDHSRSKWLAYIAGLSCICMVGGLIFYTRPQKDSSSK